MKLLKTKWRTSELLEDKILENVKEVLIPYSFSLFLVIKKEEKKRVHIQESLNTLWLVLSSLHFSKILQIQTQNPAFDQG
jgi:hypothetical protein